MHSLTSPLLPKSSFYDIPIRNIFYFSQVQILQFRSNFRFKSAQHRQIRLLLNQFVSLFHCYVAASDMQCHEECLIVSKIAASCKKPVCLTDTSCFCQWIFSYFRAQNPVGWLPFKDNSGVQIGPLRTVRFKVGVKRCNAASSFHLCQAPKRGTSMYATANLYIYFW